ncbi:hypothetical protein EDB85DRAFT_1919907 [Lactarius pseudohatsudake]|nr:hypothetical protein EDB85DRAFT_1919907 [Lactarius pseudohatsudake]
MTRLGSLATITRYGINRADTGTLTRPSLEETVEILMEVTAVGSREDRPSITENVVCGQMTLMTTESLDDATPETNRPRDIIADRRRPMQSVLSAPVDAGRTPGQVDMARYDSNSHTWGQASYNGKATASSPMTSSGGEGSANFACRSFGRNPRCAGVMSPAALGCSPSPLNVYPPTSPYVLQSPFTGATSPFRPVFDKSGLAIPVSSPPSRTISSVDSPTSISRTGHEASAIAKRLSIVHATDRYQTKHDHALVRVKGPRRVASVDSLRHTLALARQTNQTYALVRNDADGRTSPIPMGGADTNRPRYLGPSTPDQRRDPRQGNKSVTTDKCPFTASSHIPAARTDEQRPFVTWTQPQHETPPHACPRGTPTTAVASPAGLPSDLVPPRHPDRPVYLQRRLRLPSLRNRAGPTIVPLMLTPPAHPSPTLEPCTQTPTPRRPTPAAESPSAPNLRLTGPISDRDDERLQRRGLDSDFTHGTVRDRARQSIGRSARGWTQETRRTALDPCTRNPTHWHAQMTRLERPETWQIVPHITDPVRNLAQKRLDLRRRHATHRHRHDRFNIRCTPHERPPVSTSHYSSSLSPNHRPTSVTIPRPHYDLRTRRRYRRQLCYQHWVSSGRTNQERGVCHDHVTRHVSSSDPDVAADA